MDHEEVPPELASSLSAFDTALDAAEEAMQALTSYAAPRNASKMHWRIRWESAGGRGTTYRLT
jgi:hypothetical protein